MTVILSCFAEAFAQEPHNYPSTPAIVTTLQQQMALVHTHLDSIHRFERQQNKVKTFTAFTQSKLL